MATWKNQHCRLLGGSSQLRSRWVHPIFKWINPTYPEKNWDVTYFNPFFPHPIRKNLIIATDLEIEVQPLSATELTHLGRILQGQFGQLEAGERTRIHIGRFPKMGVPLGIIHFEMGFSLRNHPAIGYHHFRKPPYITMIHRGWWWWIMVMNVVNPMDPKATKFGDGKHRSHKNGDDLGMVFGIGFTMVYHFILLVAIISDCDWTIFL